MDLAPFAAMAPTSTSRPSTGAGVTTLLIFAITIVGLYFGREILVPFALAVLLSFMLAPVVDRLRAWRLPGFAAVALTVTLAFVLLGGLSAVVGNQIVELARNVPDYQETMRAKIRGLRSALPSGGILDRSTALFQTLKEEVAPQSAERPSGQTAPPAPPPRQGPLEMVGGILAPLVGPIGTAGLVLVFLVFILLERNDLRDRFIRLTGGGVHRTTGALNEAARRVSRYLVTQLIINATYGIPIGVGLYFIGVPNALLWGLLATLLRFLPYLGPFIAALFPLALAFAVDPGWNMFLWTAALIIGMELISNNFIEPWLYGSSTGLSPVAIVLAAIFWTILWGPVGLVLATPLTVCLAVMGRHVPRLEFLNVLLGNEPVLEVHERFYQRLLAGNAEEAIELAETRVAEHGRLDFYDKVALPALRLADNDRQHGSSIDDLRRVAAGLEAVIRELGGAEKDAIVAVPVLCIAGRWELDAAAAAMLAHALRERGVGARRVPAASVAPDAINALELAGVAVACVSYLDPAPQAYARFVCRRLKRRKTELKLVVGMWNPSSEAPAREQLAAEVQADAVENALAEAVVRVERLVASGAPTMVSAPIPADEAARLEALQASGLVEARSGGRLDRVASTLAEAFEMPIALVSLIDDSCQLWKGAAGLPPDLDQSRSAPRETSICGHVVAANAPLVVEDTARDPRFSGNPFLRARGIRFYAGAPLRTASGHVIGSLCVLDTKPRMLGSRDVKLLQALADELMAGVQEPAAATHGVAETA
jgi:predicted PurR-regulated permease PerM